MTPLGSVVSGMTAVNASGKKRRVESSPGEGWGKVSASLVTIFQTSTALIDVMTAMMNTNICNL